MGYPRYHDQHTLLLLYRTLNNLDFIDNAKRNNGPFEVTQLLNSFLGVLAHPWDSLLDKGKLQRLRINSDEFYRFGFPQIVQLADPIDQITIPNLYEYLRTLRNGMAHGNFELLDRKMLRHLQPVLPLPNVKEKEIAGIKVWNVKDRDKKTETINWCSAIGIRDLKCILFAMKRLCEDKQYWQADVLKAHEAKRGRVYEEAG